MPPLLFQLLLGKRIDGILRGNLDPLTDRTVVGEQIVTFRM
jgi:hypothetical protein